MGAIKIAAGKSRSPPARTVAASAEPLRTATECPPSWMRTRRCLGCRARPCRRVRVGAIEIAAGKSRSPPARTVAASAERYERQRSAPSWLRTRRCSGCRTRPGRRVRAGGLCELPAANSFAPAGGRHVPRPDSQRSSPPENGRGADLLPGRSTSDRRVGHARLVVSTLTSNALAPRRGKLAGRGVHTGHVPLPFRTQVRSRKTPRGATSGGRQVVLDNRSRDISLVVLPSKTSLVRSPPGVAPSGSRTARAEPVRPG